MKFLKNLLFALALFSIAEIKSQCIGTYEMFGPFVAPAAGAADLFFINYTQNLGNYSKVTLLAGNQYTFGADYIISVTNYYPNSNTTLTITDENNNVLVSGLPPLIYTPTNNIIVRLHQFSLNGACGTTESGNGSNGHRFSVSTSLCANLVSSTNATCQQLADGSATVSIAVSTGSNTYSWTPSGGNASTASNLAPGNYTCTITNVCNTTIALPIVIQNLAPTATITNLTDTAICTGQTSTLQAGLPGNPSIASYLWSNGATTPTINAGLGNYTVVVNTSNGCSSKPSAIKQVIPKILSTLTIQSIKDSVCSTETTTLSVNTSGITNPTFLWSNGSTQAAPIVGVGSYNVLVTEAAGCSYNSITKIIVEKTGEAKIITTPDLICANETKPMTAIIPDNRFVSSVSSHTGSYDYAILGQPNGVSWTAFPAVSAYLVANFSNPIPISYINIYELARFGTMDTVQIKNPITNQWELVYNRTADANIYSPFRITTRIAFPLTAFPVSEVRVHCTSTDPINYIFSDIDAIEIGTALPTANYNWSNGTTSLINNAVLGSHSVILTDPNGCRFLSDTILIEEKVGKATIIASLDSICSYDTKPLTAIAQEKQWAASVISHNGTSPQGITGPAGSGTWYGNASTGNPDQYIIVKYNEPKPINFINVYESSYYGTMDTVQVKNPITNQWQLVYSVIPPSGINGSSPQGVTSHLTFPVTAFPVSEVRVHARYISFVNIAIDAIEIGRDLPIASYNWSNGTTTDTNYAQTGNHLVTLLIAEPTGCRYISDTTKVAESLPIIPIVSIEEISSTSPTVSINGTVTASDTYNTNYPSDAFDGNITLTGWGATNLPAQLNYDFSGTNSEIVTKYKMYCSSSQQGGWNNYYNPKSWTFEGYNGATWDILDTQVLTNFPDNSWQSFTISNTTAYEKYRINITENNGGSTTSYVILTEMQLLIDPVFNDCNSKLFRANVNSQALPANYQWKLNGLNIGSNNDTLSLPNFAISSSITCTANALNTCLPAPTSTSNAIVLTTGAVLNVTDTIICPGQSFTFNSTTYNTTGAYTDTLIAASGCDSIFGLLLTVANPAIVSVNSGTICEGETFTISPSGASIYNISGGSAIVSPTSTASYTITGTDMYGCASSNAAISTVNVNPLPNTNTSVIGLTITSDLTGATYQWLNCDNGTAILGETNQSFTASVNGNYAVVVSDGLCSDTSACVAITSVGIKNITSNNLISIQPNPNNGTFTIKAPTKGIYTLVNELGQVIQLFELNNANNYLVSMSDLATGVYFVIGNDNNFRSKIVVTK